MKFLRICGLFILALVLASCDRSHDQEYPFEAVVLGINMDCGIPEIRFISDINEIEARFGPSPGSAVYIGKNLPEELVQENLRIKLNCRVPEAEELGACTMMGPSYPWIYVTAAIKAD